MIVRNARFYDGGNIQDKLYFEDDFTIFKYYNYVNSKYLIYSRYCGNTSIKPDISGNISNKIYLKWYRYEAMDEYKEYTLRELYACWNGFFKNSRSNWNDHDSIRSIANYENQYYTMHMNNLFSTMKNKYYQYRKENKKVYNEV